ncbi:hypothetical protein Ddye_014428 [Dipteronia dyeriana]|uniref:Protein FAR1-RELATED SEQUENCE n=1 Tax=Dipteronia dyeriana TaxID=168575 RepID=A0AAD9X888_9ROSI|nr:hypothetical protein Ddye_014428 [Dipteronia dyeriana]
MSGKTPKTIFTDQDVAMAKAILHVMPSTYHRLFTWHMMQNALELVNDVFRGEILNVAQFLIHVERAVNDKRFKELEAEYDLFYMLVNVKINAKMLIQAREVFIKAIFLEFQHEFEQAIELNMNCATIGGNIIYSANMDCASKERHVKMDSDNTLSCSCKMSEMKRVLCSHVIKILRDAFNIKEIPTQYILKRWTKQAIVECVQDLHGRVIQEDPKLQQTCRYRSLCSIFTRISSRVSKSEKAYILANEQAHNLTKLVENTLHIEMGGNNHEKEHISQTVAVKMDCAQDSNIVKAKGFKKKETSRGRPRMKSSLERALEKRKKHTKAVFHFLSRFKISGPLNTFKIPFMRMENPIPW